MSELNVYDERSNRRLVSIVRALLVCSVLSLPSPIYGLYEPDPTFTVSLLIMIGLIALSTAYMAALFFAAREQWQLARRIVFSAWAGYGASVIMLWDVALDPIVQAILLSVATLFMVVIQNATLALTPWNEARRWIGLSFVLYIGALAFAGFRQPTVDPTMFLSMIVINTVLAAAAAWPNRTVMRDLEESLQISETRRQEALDTREAVANARDQALAANTAKSRFLANMSHELRTPLNAILGYVELIQDEAEEAKVDAFDEDLNRVHQAGSHLLGLINAILDLSKIEAGKMEVFNAPVRPGEVITELAATVRPLASAKNLRVRVNLPDVLPTFPTDQQKLRQVLLNLLANAVKFTDAGSVEIAAHTTSTDLVVTVSDSGVGITPERLEKIFDAFERTEAEVTRRVGGTGLGLAISQRICELLGGSLTAASQMGRGSTFTVLIPLTPPVRRRTSLDQLTK